MNKRKPSVGELRALVPLREAPEKYLRAIGRHCEVMAIPQGAKTRQRGRKQSTLLFLLAGQLDLLNLDGDRESISGDTARAHFPIIPEHHNDLDCEFTRDSLVLQIPCKALRALRERIQDDARAEAAKPRREITPEERLAEQLAEEFQQAAQKGQIQLPGLPDVAVRVSGHIDAPESTSSSIARIIQLDPAITARLIQVANSALYAAQAPVKSCKDAITRLGRKTTRELVTSFVLKGLFRSRSATIDQRMRALWRHSTHVAALAYVLARHCRGFEPGQAMLIGLIHDIGGIPVLTHAHRHQALRDDGDLLDGVMQRLRGPIGALVLRQWGFADEFVSAAQQAEHWLRDGAQPADYVDLLLIAQLHAFLGDPQQRDLPRIDQVPAFRKLGLEALSPQKSLAILDEAEQEIAEMRALLG